MMKEVAVISHDDEGAGSDLSSLERLPCGDVIERDQREGDGHEGGGGDAAHRRLEQRVVEVLKVTVLCPCKGLLCSIFFSIWFLYCFGRKKGVTFV